jgi:hypothetical protein
MAPITEESPLRVSLSRHRAGLERDLQDAEDQIQNSFQVIEFARARWKRINTELSEVRQLLDGGGICHLEECPL